jgi:N12 class adenine-specific DNA methylase
MDKVVVYGAVAIGILAAGAYGFQQWAKKREADADAAEQDLALKGPAIWNPTLAADLAVADLSDEKHIHETCSAEANKRVREKKKQKVNNGFDEWYWNTFNREDHWYEKYYDQCISAYGGQS